MLLTCIGNIDNLGAYKSDSAFPVKSVCDILCVGVAIRLPRTAAFPTIQQMQSLIAAFGSFPFENARETIYIDLRIRKQCRATPFLVCPVTTELHRTARSLGVPAANVRN